MVKTLRPFFSFYGAKWRSAVKYYPEPRHGKIVEPFAGSAGYSLRYPDRQIILCDADPIIASLWKYLIRVSPGEILSIPDVPEGGSVSDLRLCPEAEALVGFWLNRGGAQPSKQPSKWMRQRVAPGAFWGDQARHRIASQVDSIRHWQIHLADYKDCPVSGAATYFVDPPYQVTGRRYKYGSDKINYDHLGSWCRSRNGQVIVCENEGATWLPFENLASIRTTRKGRTSKEAIWTNEQPHREDKI